MLGASVGGLLYDAAGFAIPFYVCGGILLSSAMLALWKVITTVFRYLHLGNGT